MAACPCLDIDTGMASLLILQTAVDAALGASSSVYHRTQDRSVPRNLRCACRVHPDRSHHGWPPHPDVSGAKGTPVHPARRSAADGVDHGNWGCVGRQGDWRGTGNRAERVKRTGPLCFDWSPGPRSRRTGRRRLKCRPGRASDAWGYSWRWTSVSGLRPPKAHELQVPTSRLAAGLGGDLRGQTGAEPTRVAGDRHGSWPGRPHHPRAGVVGQPLRLRIEVGADVGTTCYAGYLGGEVLVVGRHRERRMGPAAFVIARGGCLRRGLWRRRRAWRSCRGRTAGWGRRRSRRPWSV